MSLNLAQLDLSQEAISPVTLTTSPAAASSGFSLGNAWGEVKDLAKFYTAAKYAPGSLTSAPVTPTTPSSPEAGKSLGDALAPIAAVFAADEAVKRTNKNPPYMIYTLIVLGLAGVYIVVNRPVRGA